jgi:hypothetical protein
LGRPRPDDGERTAGPSRARTVTRNSRRSRCPRPREARRGLGKARRASGTRAGGPDAEAAAVRSKHKTMNRKVVDLTTPYNFHKGCIVFFSTDFAGTPCQL